MGKRSAPSVLVVLASARAEGNMAAAVGRLSALLSPDKVQVVDLLPLRIEPFRYGGDPGRDDFAAVTARMLRHRHIVLATPVYWYAMSGLMKTFLDRLTDLVATDAGRPIGRRLAGRNLWLLASGTDRSLSAGFHEPFELTAGYFDMRWRGAFYVPVLSADPPEAADFSPVDRLCAALRDAIEDAGPRT